MNLAELKDHIDFTINNLHSLDKPEDIPVLITLSESSVGARASTKVIHVGMGMDWESGQFRIYPESELVRKGKALTDAKLVIEHLPLGGGRKIYICQSCGCYVGKEDRFCKHCSQKLI